MLFDQCIRSSSTLIALFVLACVLYKGAAVIFVHRDIYSFHLNLLLVLKAGDRTCEGNNRVL